MFKPNLVLGVFLLGALNSLTGSTSLNTPSLLLPHTTHIPVNFTLRVEKGLYRWVSSRPEGVKVYPLSSSSPPNLLPLSSCSQHALVSALFPLWTPPGRGASVIQAQDPVSGHTLRCDVITDRIQSLEIITTARHLFTDDPPLQLSVQATDSEGNTFSSLAGLEFDWRLSKGSDTGEIARDMAVSRKVGLVKWEKRESHKSRLTETSMRYVTEEIHGQPVPSLRFVRFSDTGYTPALHVLSLEMAGRRGDSVLLQGVHSGTTRVRVSLSVPEHKQVVEASVSLFVIDRLYLSPADDIYLLVNAAVTYSVWRTQREGENEVTLSEGGYKLKLESHGEDDVVSIDQETSTITALRLGHATLTLTHRSLQHESASLLPRASLHVVEPSYLTLSIQEEEDRWVLETGRQYHLLVRVHDSEGHVLRLPQNATVRVELCDKFAVLDSSPNLSSHLVQTRSAGRTTVQASLLSNPLAMDGQSPVFIPPIRVQLEVEIYEPLTLHPAEVVFPWQPDNELYEYTFQVQGGSGSVNWAVSDSDIATVTVTGTVRAGKKRGQAQIEASDTRNPLHKALGRVLVVRPCRLQLLPSQADCVVGGEIDLPLSVWGVQDTSSTHSHTHPDSELHCDPNARLHSAMNSPSPGSLSPASTFCGGVHLKAVAPGHTLVTVTVETEWGNISATATLAAYSPLQALVSEVLLTVGSSRLLVFEGGPQPWPPAPARFFSHTHALPEGSIAIEELSLTDVRLTRHVYRVTCTAVGEQWLVFKCGNTPGSWNEVPSVEESRVRVVCGVPATLHLSPLASSSPPPMPPAAHHYSCPEPQYPSSLFAVSSKRATVLQLTVFDQKGAQFDNFTSCTVDWMTSDPALVSILKHSTMSLFDLPTQTGYKLHGRQLFQSHGQTGMVTVTVTLSSSGVWGILVSLSVMLHLVEDVQWDRRSVTLYNHPGVTENLTLTQGSGHFLVRLQDKDIANMTYVEKTNIVQISPIRPGFTSLLVHDLCLTSPEPALPITVSGISDFQIDFVDIVEVGRSALVRVRVLDSHGQPFLQHFFVLMRLKLLPSSSIVTVEELGPVDRYSVGFHVSGQAVGVVSLHLSAVDSSGNVLSSSHKHMQVYPQFNLQPQKLALALGSVRQVKWEGGPHPQSSVGFSVSDSRIASVTESGLVRGLAVGVAKVRGALQTVTQDTGALLTFAQDEVEVEVFNLTGVRIQAPLVRMPVGTEMPVYVMGSDSSQNPLALGSVEAGLNFHWSLGKLGVLEIQTRHTQAGVSVSPSHSFSVLVKAWAAGRTSLKVCVQPTHNSSLAEQLTDEIQILVFEEMQLTAGTPTSILMSPHSQYTLQSNKGSVCPVRYALCQCVSGAGLVIVDDLGVLKAGPDSGVALLEIIAMEACGINQTLLISVKVAAVWFVRLVSEASLRSDVANALTAFPLGWTIRVSALCYDSMGLQFHAHSTQTRITTNRDDLVQVTADAEPHSFLVQSVSSGLTVLGIQGDPTNPALCDYTPLPVSPAISVTPTMLRPGDAVCFNSLLTNRTGQQGMWDVSSSRILQVDPDTGAALAKNSGTVVVYYRLETGQQALREVKVEAAGVPILSAPERRLLTNWPLAPDYTVSVELHTSVANMAQCSLSQQEAIEKKLQPEKELQCSLHFSAPYLQLNTLQAVFHTTPLYDMDTAQYGCRISVQPQSDSVLHLLSSLPLSVSLSASLRGHTPLTPFLPFPFVPSSVSPPVQLPYVGAFHCPHTHVSLTALQPLSEITVMGTNDMISSLKFHSDSPDIHLSEPSPSAQNPAHCVVSVYTDASHFKHKAPSAANITIYTGLTPQTHTVRVTVLNDGQTETGHLEPVHFYASPLHQLLDFQLILMFAVFAVLTITATMFIVYNSMVSRLQNVPVTYTAPAFPVVNGPHYTPWTRPSPHQDRPLHWKQWLWSSRSTPFSRLRS